MHRIWFQSVKHPGTPASDTHVFGFPYAGGSATSLLALRDMLDPSVGLHLATLPGRGRRVPEAANPGIHARGTRRR